MIGRADVASVDTAVLSAAAPGDAFLSLAALRAQHADLLRQIGDDRKSAHFQMAIADFMRRGRATGALISVDDERWAAQSLLDYWTTVLFRMGCEPPDATLVDFDPELSPKLANDLCPYLGLDPFREGTSNLFFGRRRLVDDWVCRLKAHRFLFAEGPSGSGKSSLVLGGLVPSLRAGALPGSERWHYFSSMVPGSDPLAALARLMQPSGAAADWTQSQSERYRQDSGHLTRQLDELGGAPAVVVVDQLEELFTLCKDESAVRAFADNLLAAIQAPTARHIVIASMRSDFEDRLARLPDFQALCDQARVHVTALTGGELHDAIEKPAELVGLKFEEGIVDELVNEMVGQTGGLPLLQFTLLKLWEGRDHNRVPFEVYRRLRGPKRALEQAADGFYKSLIYQEQVAVRRILLQMVQPGEGDEVTGKRIRVERLFGPGEDNERTQEVLDKLIQARLVRLTAGDTPADNQVEVAHEALIRNWSTLANWLEDEREGRRQRQRVTSAAEQWKALGRDPAGLLRGSVLDEARRYHDLTPLEAEFIQESQHAEELAEREREEAHRREVAHIQALADEQRRRAVDQAHASARLRQRAYALGGAFGLALVFLVGTAFFGWRAYDESRVAMARLLAAQALNEGPAQRDLAMLLSLESYRIQPTSDAINSLLAALDLMPDPTISSLRRHQDTVETVAFSPDGQIVATGSLDRTIGLWSVSARQPLGPPLVGPAAGVSVLAFDPDGRVLVAGGVDGTLSFWDVPARRQIAGPLARHDEPVRSLAFSTDGRTVLSGGDDGKVVRWALTTGTPEPEAKPLLTLDVPITSMAIGFDGIEPRLAIGSPDGKVGLWDLTSGAQISLRQLPGIRATKVSSLTFNSDGKLLAAGANDGRLTLWDLTDLQRVVSVVIPSRTAISGLAFTPNIVRDSPKLAAGTTNGELTLWNTSAMLLNRQERAQIGIPFTSATSEVTSIAFSPDGLMIASGNRDGHLILRDTSTSKPMLLGRPLTSGNAWATSPAMAFSQDGTLLAATSGDTMVELWDVQEQVARTPPFTGLAAPVSRLAFSPDDHILAAGGIDGTLTLWDVERRQQIGALLGPDSGVRRAPVSALTFSADGTTLASSGGETIAIWDVATHRSLGQFRLDLKAAGIVSVSSMAFSPDGRTLVSGSPNGMLMVWDVSTGQPLGAPLYGSASMVNSVAFNAAGNQLVSGHYNGTLNLWDIGSRQQLGPSLYSVAAATPRLSPTPTLSSSTVQASGSRFLEPSTIPSAVTSVAFSPDGARIASGRFDGAVSLWDVASRRRIGPPLAGHTTAVRSLAFKPDGQALASGSSDSPVIVWDVTVDSWLKSGCKSANRNLTWAEWQLYLPDERYHKTCPDLPFPLSLTASGDRELAAMAYDEQVQTSLQTSDASANNSLCWQGSIAGFARNVMPACLHAVELVPTDGRYADSRGLARALTRDYPGAIQDFKAFIDWMDKNPEWVKRNPAYGAYRGQRESWIAALQGGRNPFDDTTLRMLKSQ